MVECRHLGGVTLVQGEHRPKPPRSQAPKSCPKVPPKASKFSFPPPFSPKILQFSSLLASSSSSLLSPTSYNSGLLPPSFPLRNGISKERPSGAALARSCWSSSARTRPRPRRPCSSRASRRRPSAARRRSTTSIPIHFKPLHVGILKEYLFETCRCKVLCYSFCCFFESHFKSTSAVFPVAF